MKKRIAVALSALCFLATVIQADSGYQYRYWFDGDFANAVGGSADAGAASLTLDAAGLGFGMHTVCFQIKDADGNWGSNAMRAFFRTIDFKYGDATGSYWFDDDYGKRQPLSVGVTELATDSLADGLHTVNTQFVAGDFQMPTASRFFFKAPAAVSFSDATGAYWFDDDYATRQPLSVGITELATDGLADGLHTVIANFSAGDFQMPTASRFFFKAPAAVSFSDASGSYWFDDDYSTRQPLSVGVTELATDGLADGLHTVNAQFVAGDFQMPATQRWFFKTTEAAHIDKYCKVRTYIDSKLFDEKETAATGGIVKLDLDASTLANGLHSIRVILSNEEEAVTQIAAGWFFKIPVGGVGVTAYEYWLNENRDGVKGATLPGVTNPFALLATLDMEEEPLRSSFYTFAVEDGEPMVYARNVLHVLFKDVEGIPILDHGEFTDVRVRQAVEADYLEPGRTTVASIADNTIKWYRFLGEIGDSVAVRLDRAASYELYSPTAEKLLSSSGASATVNQATTLQENGTYYLAVHDITSSRKSDLGIDFAHIGKFAVLSYTPTRTAADGFLLMDLFGNGYEQLTSAKLGEVVATAVKAADNYNAHLMFDTSTLPIGTYPLTLTFNDEGEEKVLVMDHAVKVEPASPGEIKVEVGSRRILADPYPVTITLTNTGNVGYWGVPVNMAFDNVGVVETMRFSDFKVMVASGDDGEADGDGEAEAGGDKQSPYLLTDNLFGTSKEGCYIPLVVPYLAPASSVTFTLGVTAGGHARFMMYANAGEPWSEEYKHYLTASGDIAYDPNYVVDSNVYTLGQLLATLDVSSDEIKAAWGDILQKLHTASISIDGEYTDIAYSIDPETQTASETTPTTTIPKKYMMAQRPISTKHIVYLVNIIRKKRGKDVDTDHDIDKNPDKPLPLPRHSYIEVYMPYDPNEITGYTSPGETEHVGIDVATLNYTIEFENDPELANAAAHKIVVTDQLDGEKFDLTSLKMRAVKIGDQLLELDGESALVRTIDMRPAIDVIAEVAFAIDGESGVAQWTINSLDPMTLDPTDDAMRGVLPVNVDGNGIGQLIFDINLRQGLADATRIENKALIVFDTQDAIETNVWANITDYVRPEASIVSVATDDNQTFSFTVSGSDAGSGIWHYDLYMRRADSQEYRLVMAQVADDAFSYTAPEVAEGAQFFVLATDRAGNYQVEAKRDTYLIGDADSNGQINANDAVVIRNYYTGLTSDIMALMADISGNGTIDAQDAIAVRNLYLQSIARAPRTRLISKHSTNK